MLIPGLTNQAIDYSSPVPTPWIVIGGLIVGVGVYFGSAALLGLESAAWPA